MDLIELAVGIVLIGSALIVELRLTRRLRGWPRPERLRVKGASLVFIVVWFAVMWSSVPVSTWWIVPAAFAGTAVLDLASLRLAGHARTA